MPRVSRSSFYDEPQGETAMSLDLMLLIDKQFLETPFFGVRQMTWHLQNEGHAVNEKRIRRLMRLMRVRRENSLPDCFLILLRADLPETRHQQAREGAQDLSLSAGRAADRPAKSGLVQRYHPRLRGGRLYIPMRKGFLYLVAIMDWFTRKVLAGRISNTLEADFCLEALNEAIHKFGPPEIMNTDQGSQFTSFDWTDRLKRAKTKISMDGKARYLDNIFIERLWRSLKYECVYLHAWETGSQAKAGVGRWITFYNHQRPHAAHGGHPPAMVYFNAIETDQQVQAVA